MKTTRTTTNSKGLDDFCIFEAFKEFANFINLGNEIEPLEFVNNLFNNACVSKNEYFYGINNKKTEAIRSMLLLLCDSYIKNIDLKKSMFLAFRKLNSEIKV